MERWGVCGESRFGETGLGGEKVRGPTHIRPSHPDMCSRQVPSNEAFLGRP